MKPLSGPQRKFCEAYAVEKNGAAAYLAAYPNCSPSSAEAAASRLLRNVNIRAEIDRIRDLGQQMAGSAALTLAEIHVFLARVVRCKVGQLTSDSDLLQAIKHTKDGSEYRVPDKLAAIARWCDIKGEGASAEADNALCELLGRIRKGGSK